MQSEHQDKLYAFAHAARTLLDVPFLFLDRRLSAMDYLDRTQMPGPISKSYDEFFYGGSLFDCEVPDIYEVRTGFGIYFAVLPLRAPDGFGILGPYLAEDAPLSLDEVLLQNRVPMEEKEVYLAYLHHLPVLSVDKVRVMLEGLAVSLGRPQPRQVLRSVEISPEHPAPCPVLEEDSLQARADAIVSRYEGEHYLLECISRGELPEGWANNSFFLDRFPNRLRSEKNTLIVVNTLFRKALEPAKVHPLYIDEISGKWAVRIEEAATLSQIAEIKREMPADYCRVVRSHSLANYTKNVRRAINDIHFHLSDSELSLKKVAQRLGVSPSYLSQQFNREVGVSFPEYVAGLRMAEARRMLRGPAGLSISRIAAAVGYADLNYFTKVFRRYTGLTPTAYRQQGN